MNPRNFHLLARELSVGGSAAKYPSSISRAYYAAFHVGSETLRALGFTIRRGAAAHGEVAICFANSGDAHTRDAARVLSALHGLRNRADYQLDRADVEQSAPAIAAVDQAQSVIDTFDRISNSPRRPQIQAAIALWRKSNGYP